jgi:hypothetical protein
MALSFSVDGEDGRRDAGRIALRDDTFCSINDLAQDYVQALAIRRLA